MPSQIAGRCTIETALRMLRKLRMPFRGPFTTPSKNHIYIVGECVLTEAEILALHGDGKLKAGNHQLLLDLKRLQNQDTGNSVNELR